MTDLVIMKDRQAVTSSLKEIYLAVVKEFAIKYGVWKEKN